MERLIHNKLYPYLEFNDILTSKQNGFRKKHGTPDTIFKLITHIINNLNKKKTTIAVFIYIDFKKAFDTLDHMILTHGVPQGSLLGPLLFNLYIYGLPNIVQSDMILYADDSVVFASGNSLQIACNMVLNDLIGVGTWCKHHKLSINVNKTKAMHFGIRDVEDVSHLNISISNNQIEFVNCYKYLGIHLDSKMSFNFQFKETYKLASYKLFLLKRIR